MSGKMVESSRVSVIGEIMSGFTFSHEVFGEGFYMMDVAVNRPSEQTNIIPLMISERLIDVYKDYSGCTMGSIGQFHSYSRHEGVKNRLMLSVFVRKIHFIEEFTDYTRTNQISSGGYVCKPPIYRKTLPERETADILLAVNHPYGKSDCIPCISWRRSACFASGFEVDTRVRVWSRMQSREYTKKLSETKCERHITYGVSVNKLECGEA